MACWFDMLRWFDMASAWGSLFRSSPVPFDRPLTTGTEEEKLRVFRQVRDEIRRVFEAYAKGRLDAERR